MSARDVDALEERVRRDCERVREGFRRRKTPSLAARMSNSVDRIHSNSLHEQIQSTGTNNVAAEARDPDRTSTVRFDDERRARTVAWVDRNSDFHNLPSPNSSPSPDAVPIHTGPSKMQDPSYGVLHGLLPHVHLISNFRYPVQQSLNQDTILEYLTQAPKIVREVAPVAWTYLAAPPADGTVFLEWQPESQRQTRFASDGYVWADPEANYQFERHGYTVDMWVHRSGFRPGMETIACHSRKRYRLWRNPPSMGASAPDTSLWIVHYSQAEPQHRVQAVRVPIHPEVTRELQERRFWESQGQLQRKDFMLYDRSNWPNIDFGSGRSASMSAQASLYSRNPLQQIPGTANQFYPQTQGGAIGPPAKRPRQAPPSQLPAMPTAAAGMPHDTSIEDEENTTLGDLLDHLTPRDISSMRYVQHHEWMEEVFSSPYATAQIMPVELGFGLSGELAKLTEGIFDAPNYKDASRTGALKPYHKLDPDKYAEFEKRVADYMSEGQKELERMMSEHAKKMAQMKQESRAWSQAERRLRNTMFDDAHGSRHDGVQRSRADLEGVVAELELTVGVRISPQQDFVCVQKGGLIEEEAQQPNGKHINNGASGPYPGNGALNGIGEDSVMGADNTAASLLDQYGTSSFATTPAANIPTPQLSHPTSQAQSARATPSAVPADQTQHANYQDQTDLEDTTDNQVNDDLLMEGIDLDIDMSGLPDTTADDKTVGESDWVMVDQSGEDQAQAQSTAAAATVGDSGAATAGSAITMAQAQDSSVALPATATGNDDGPAAAITITAETPGPQAEDQDPGSMFDSTDFGGFGNLDTAGDALADYTAGAEDLDLGLEDSAFVDAFGGEGEGGEGA